MNIDELDLEEQQRQMEDLLGYSLPIKKEYLLPNPPSLFSKDTLEVLLFHCYDIGSSDIHIESGSPIIVDVHGVFYPVILRNLNNTEIISFLDKIYGTSAMTKINSAEPIDTNYTIRDSHGVSKYRYRINVVGTQVDGNSDCMQITIRTIPHTPPSIQELGVEPVISKSFFAAQGLIVVTGPTGSGKSTLMASCIRNVLETKGVYKKIVTYEAPIEFVYTNVIKRGSLIYQTEVPTNLKNFNVSIETAMRRKPNIILIGEARDQDTIRNIIMASQTGHLGITTSHTNSVSETMRRFINMFPSNERSSIQMDLIDSLQMIVAQRLLKTIDGKRVAVKESLFFTKEIKDKLVRAKPDAVPDEIRKILRASKSTIVDDAIEKYKEKRISFEVLQDFARDFGIIISNKKSDSDTISEVQEDEEEIVNYDEGEV